GAASHLASPSLASPSPAAAIRLNGFRSFHAALRGSRQPGIKGVESTTLTIQQMCSNSPAGSVVSVLTTYAFLIAFRARCWIGGGPRAVAQHRIPVYSLNG